jgi:hypothetical protein
MKHVSFSTDDQLAQVDVKKTNKKTTIRTNSIQQQKAGGSDPKRMNAC